MSSLKAIEKRVFEDLFGMASGYVLDFSNNTFAEFFRETANIDIYAPKYDFNGDSKAKRLRAFWETEPDALVGKILAGLLEVWQYNAARNGQTNDSPQYKQAAGIVARLTGKQPNPETTEQEFLHRQYQNISIKNLSIDPNLVPVIESRLAEAQNCLASAPLATIFLCGSILEGILLGVALQKPKEFNQAANSPKDKENTARIQIHTRQAYGRDLPASTQGSHRRFIRRPEMSCRNRQIKLCGQGGRCGRCKTGRDHV